MVTGDIHVMANPCYSCNTQKIVDTGKRQILHVPGPMAVLRRPQKQVFTNYSRLLTLPSTGTDWL